ncbi:MAG: hypothetical protein FWE16_02890 [Firmicutes bacterium]|nr:hypothetical protein [Bacillota bacterium]
MRVAVYGGTNSKEYTKKDMDESQKLGRFLATKGVEVVTGACLGFPYFVGKEVVQNGGKVIGFSPAKDEAEHIERYKFLLDGCSYIRYMENPGETQAQNFTRRGVDLTENSDLVVAIGGSWGTYTELLFSFIYKRPIILIEEFGGAVEAFANTWKFFNERDYNPEVHYGSRIIRVKTVDEAIEVLEKEFI